MIVKFSDHMGFDYNNPDPYETDTSRDTSGYHAGNVSPWMESLPLDKPRIGFIREPAPVLDTNVDIDDEPITDPSWMLI